MVDQENFRLCKEVSLRVVWRDLFFHKPAKTSRDVLTVHHAHYIILENEEGEVGIGECSPIWKLSREKEPDFTAALRLLESGNFDFYNFQTLLQENPSIRFAIETACLDLKNGGLRIVFPGFEQTRISINGLVWMNDLEEMKREAESKIEAGFDTIKFKVGALRFEDELQLIKSIRKKYGANITIRLDANGAFQPSDAMQKLEKLAEFQIHSIEQPIKPGNGEIFADIIRRSPIPIALDEELIGAVSQDEKNHLLELLQPAYIILKPTLHQGLSGCDEWIELAEAKKIGWWITSALESNIGLNAIAQWTASKHTKLPQGLGTGGIYKNNIPSPLKMESGNLYWSAQANWDLSELFSKQ